MGAGIILENTGYLPRPAPQQGACGRSWGPDSLATLPPSSPSLFLPFLSETREEKGHLSCLPRAFLYSGMQIGLKEAVMWLDSGSSCEEEKEVS